MADDNARPIPRQRQDTSAQTNRAYARPLGRVPCSEVRVTARHRKDSGNLDELAKSIQTVGLLQPIGVTPANELVFGERRLLAVRDILKRPSIEAIIVDLVSILDGEFHENEFRKDFTVSERVAIANAMKKELGSRQARELISSDLNLWKKFHKSSATEKPARSLPSEPASAMKPRCDRPRKSSGKATITS